MTYIGYEYTQFFAPPGQGSRSYSALSAEEVESVSEAILNIFRQQSQQHGLDFASDRFVRITDPRYVGRRI
jgi:hypothetical protein